jgi:hypothetical protein
MNNFQYLSDKLNDQLLKVNQFKLDIWKEHVLFGWHWWFGVLFAIVSIIVWIIFHDRKMTAKLLLAGLTAAILSAFLDTTFLFFGLFDYRYEVSPMASNYIPWNFFIIPVLIMFTIQLFNNLNIYLKGIILSLIMSFIGLPLLKLMGIFEAINWHYFYSFIILFIIFVLSYQISNIAKENNE